MVSKHALQATAVMPRFKRGIQYAATHPFIADVSGRLDRPLSRTMTVEIAAATHTIQACFYAPRRGAPEHGRQPTGVTLMAGSGHPAESKYRKQPHAK
jgi:hypothetical protein